MSSLAAGDRQESIWQVVQDCLLRRAQGDEISDASLMDRHPELMPELAEELRALRAIEDARRHAEALQGRMAHAAACGDAIHSGARPKDARLRVRCPHCYSPTEVVAASALVDIECSACGSRFSLVGEEPSKEDDSPRPVGRFQLVERLGIGGFGAVWKARDKDLERWVAIKLPRAERLSAAGAEQFLREARAAAQLRHPLGGNIDEVHHVAFLPDGKTLASGGEEGLVRLWDLSTGTLQHSLRCGKGGGHRFMFSDDGTKVAAGGMDGIVMIWDVQSGAELQVLRGHTGKCHVCGPWDGRTLWSVGLDGTLRHWDAATGELVSTVTRSEWQGYVNVAFSLDGRTVAMGQHNGSIRLIDKASGQDAYTLIGHRGGVHGLAFSGDGRLLASADDRGNIIIWDLVSRQRQRTLRGHAGFVRSLIWSPDGKRLASASGDGIVKVWDDASLADNSLCRGHTWFVRCMAFDPHGRLLASGSSDKMVKLWDAATCNLLRTLEGHTGWVGDVAFSPDGELLASASDEEVGLWNVATGQSRATLMVHSGYLGSLAFCPNGKWLASGGDDGTVRLWDPKTGELVRSIEIGRGPIHALRFNHSGAAMAAGHSDGRISLWNPQTGKELVVIRSPATDLTRIAFSPSGQTLAACSETQKTVELYTLTGEVLMRFDHGAGVQGLAFSPDGRILATSGIDRGVRLWDVATGHERAAFVEGHGQWLQAIAFSPDGTVLAAGDEDGTIYLWRTASVPLAPPVLNWTQKTDSLFPPFPPVHSSSVTPR